MIKNEYTIVDDTVIFHIIRRNGDKHDILIDLDDLPKIDEVGYKLHVGWYKKIRGFYAEATQYLGMANGKPRYKKLILHRLIMNEHNSRNKIDHRDNNPLNNKKENLRLSTQETNSQNRSGLNINNKSGYRNVSWSNSRQKWIVQLQVNHKNKVLGTFAKDKLEEAGRFAEEMRKLYYGEFAGKG
jgi:hypothetical protein